MMFCDTKYYTYIVLYYACRNNTYVSNRQMVNIHNYKFIAFGGPTIECLCITTLIRAIV